ncbi:MAG: Fis family transcriptional regulator [Thermoprotei archaeon]|nr:MAG: Fis family transcriptional regulator [Thermoprotei archaeon]
MNLDSIYRAASVILAVLRKRPLGLCDASDLDGIVCAALFKMRYPRGVVVLASPAEVSKSLLIRSVTWTYVADLPCPGRAYMRADHHATNPPCAVHEFYDPHAPAAATLAIKALGLEGDSRAEKLVELAVEADTASIRSKEALTLSDAVKGSSYRGKLRLVELLAFRQLEDVLSDEEVRRSAERYSEVRAETEELAKKLPVEDELVVFFEKDRGLSYRYLCILMERRGVKLTAMLVPRGLRHVRAYLGSSTPEYDVSIIARRLGGGGHAYAAGALVGGATRRRALRRVLREIASYLGRDALKVYVVDDEGLRAVYWRF